MMISPFLSPANKLIWRRLSQRRYNQLRLLNQLQPSLRLSRNTTTPPTLVRKLADLLDKDGDALWSITAKNTD